MQLVRKNIIYDNQKQYILEVTIIIALYLFWPIRFCWDKYPIRLRKTRR